jgi:TetR/AcrR family transcriptional regulator
MQATRGIKIFKMSLKQAKTSPNKSRIRGTALEGVRATRLAQGSIRARNQAKILKAAEAVFAEKGFDGATTAGIAARAGVPKANIHYYFGTKQQLYDRLIEHILAVWLDAMDVIHEGADPAEAIGSYISEKVRASQAWPDLSRVWAIEIIGGARNVSGFLKGRLRRIVQEKGKVLAKWAEEGRMDPIDPAHLMFMIWAATQTYADFSTQIAAVLAKKHLDEEVFASAEETIKTIVLKGCGLAGKAQAERTAPLARSLRPPSPQPSSRGERESATAVPSSSLPLGRETE